MNDDQQGLREIQRVPSPLRYPGGKSKFLKEIIPRIFTPYTEFREPFVGGGSVFLTAMQNINPNAKYIINDLNYSLYSFWKELKENGKELIDEIERIKKVSTDGKALYNQFKTNACDNTFDEAVRFFILNRITFSGITDSGGYSEESFHRRFTNSSIERLRILPEKLKNVHISKSDYEKIILEPGKSVSIFLDPPYLTAVKSKLYGNKGNLHTDFDHNRFVEVMKHCPHRWLVTYDDCPEIRRLFSFAYSFEWRARYGMGNISSKSPRNGKEIFFANYDLEKNTADSLFVE